MFFVWQFQASVFLVSSNSHSVSEERELNENVFLNDNYVEDGSLLEQVGFSYLSHCSSYAWLSDTCTIV